MGWGSVRGLFLGGGEGEEEDEEDEEDGEGGRDERGERGRGEGGDGAMTVRGRCVLRLGRGGVGRRADGEARGRVCRLGGGRADNFLVAGTEGRFDVYWLRLGTVFRLDCAAESVGCS